MNKYLLNSTEIQNVALLCAFITMGVVAYGVIVGDFMVPTFWEMSLHSLSIFWRWLLMAQVIKVLYLLISHK